MKPGEPELIDHDLAMAESAWRELPQLERVLLDGPPDDHVAFVLEWSIQDDRRRRLEEARRRGLMDEAQLERHDALRVLMKENGPVLERIADI